MESTSQVASISAGPDRGDLKVEYKYCQTCGGAMSERIEYASDMQTIVSWLRYEYDGLNLLRIDERYDGETPAGLDENDPWRPLNVFIHGPGAIGQIVKPCRVERVPPVVFGPLPEAGLGWG